MSHVSTERRLRGRKINPFLMMFIMLLVYSILISGFFVREIFFSKQVRDTQNV